MNETERKMKETERKMKETERMMDEISDEEWDYLVDRYLDSRREAE